MVFAARPCERRLNLGATAAGFARVVAAVVPTAPLLAAAIAVAPLTAAALFAAAGLAAAAIAVAAIAAATVAVAAVLFATAARSGSAARLGAAARGGRSRTGWGSASRSGAARFAARRTALSAAATAGVQPIAQALPAAVLLAARRGGIATAATAGLDLGGGQQQQAERQRETTGSALHGRELLTNLEYDERGKRLVPIAMRRCLGAAVAFRNWRPGLFPGHEESSGSAGKC